MTSGSALREQKKELQTILLDENREAQNKGMICLNHGIKTINSLIKAAPAEAVARFIKDYRDGTINRYYEQIRTTTGQSAGLSKGAHLQDPSGRIAFLLARLYVSGPEPDSDGPFRAAWEAAVADLVQGEAKFYLTAQLPELNVIACIAKAIGPKGVNQSRDLDVSLGGRTYSFNLANADRHKWRAEQLSKMLYVFLGEMWLSGPNVCIHIDDYAEKTGTDISTASARKQFREDVRHDMATLADLAWYRGADKIGLGGNTHMITRDGYICWEWGAAMAAYINKRHLGEFEISAETLRAKGTAYFISLWLDLNWRQNEGKERVHKIRLATLADRAFLEPLASLREQKYSTARIRKRRMEPVFTALDSFERFGYDTYTKDGRRIDDPLRDMTIEEFETGYILVDYSGYPQHPERVAKKKKHIQAARKKKAKKAAEDQEAKSGRKKVDPKEGAEGGLSE